jgi:hypothetical protein
MKGKKNNKLAVSEQTHAHLLTAVGSGDSGFRVLT